MINIKFSDRDIIKAESGISVYEAAKEAGKITREVIAAKVNGEVCGLSDLLLKDADIELLTFKDSGGKKAFWHTASHVMAHAVKRLFPDVKLTIGPSVETGFYYDFDSEITFSTDILEKIEAEMKKIVKENLILERFTLPREKAKELMQKANEPYKILLIDRVPEGEEISFYRQGDFVDLCAGPHLFSTGAIRAFSLLQSTGAYWEGDSKNKMLQRIYGVAFPSKGELGEHLLALEEAKKRDHNKIGRELEYFTTADIIGQGLPVLLPKGARVIQILQRFAEDEEERRGYLLTKTPLMAKSDLYKLSGHWEHYKSGMFVIGDEEEENSEVFALRPMTCPFQYQVFLNRMRSYRDLPMRLSETSTLFRNEESGEMHGLIRLRQFTISEGHIICTPEQLESEFKNALELANYMLHAVGLFDDVSYRFSQWDAENREKYIGTPEQWDEAQSVMTKILDDIGVEYSTGVGEAAFYGPKLDIQIKNVHGKEDTLITIQIDQMLAEKFGMEYIASDGTKKNPYIIHRTSLGCYERTLALLLEKYAGALPLWMAPTQIKILPISDSQNEYVSEIAKKCAMLGIRVECDRRNEKIGYKIREAQMQKVPYMLVIGQKELEEGTVSVRSRKDGDMGGMSVDDFIEKVQIEIETKKI